MTEKKKVLPKEQKEARFTKEQILESQRYSDNLDLVGALFHDGSYTLSEVDAAIADFKKRKVK